MTKQFSALAASILAVYAYTGTSAKADPAATAGAFTEANANACLSKLAQKPYKLGDEVFTSAGGLSCHLFPASGVCWIEVQERPEIDPARPLREQPSHFTQLKLTAQKNMLLVFNDAGAEFAVGAAFNGQIRMFKRSTGPHVYEDVFPGTPPEQLEGKMERTKADYAKKWFQWMKDHKCVGPAG